MKITVHIGSTKTGSSALQMHLALARENLKNVGILYPEEGSKSNAHHVLFAAVHPGAWGMHSDILSNNEEERFGYFSETLASIICNAENANCQHIVLSSEYWWGVLPGRFQRVISDHVQKHELRLVTCLRRQDRWLEASYLQAIKSGEKRPFGEWLDNRLSGPNMGGANYLAVLEHWSATLKPKEIVVIPYEFTDRTIYIRSVVEAVCDASVGEVVVPLEARVVNKSPNAEGVEAILELNKSSKENARAKKINMIMSKLARPENTKSATLLTELEQRRLLRQFDSINMSLQNAYGNNEGKSFFLDDDIRMNDKIESTS